MAQPPAYTPTTDFSDYAASNPGDPMSGTSLDGEFANIKTTTDGIRTNLALIQRDDGEIANQSVGLDQLAPSLTLSFNPPENWVTATAFTVNDTCFYDGEFYSCLEAHTSGTFATDLAAGKWQKVTDFLTVIEAEVTSQVASQVAAEVADTFAVTPSGAASTALSIASGAVIPTGAAHSLTSESSTSDTLDEVTPTNIPDGGWLLLRPTSGHTITVTHNAGGATNPIILPDGRDVVLEGNAYLALLRVGASWYAWAVTQPSPGSVTKTSSFSVALTDRRKKFSCDPSGGDITAGLLAVATAGGDFRADIANSGASGLVTIDPNASELINGRTSITLVPGATAYIWSDGSEWVAVVSEPPVVAGECRLAYTNATTLTLSRHNGRFITISGQKVEIPSAGVTVDTTGLSSSTVYFVYAYVSGGNLTLELSATGHATDSTTGGVEVKAGDGTRTLVGMARTNGSTQFVNSATQRFVRSWFNDQPFHMENIFSAQRTTTSSGFAELNTEIRCEFLLWDDDLFEGGLSGYAFNSTTDYCLATIGIDGTSTTVPGVGSVNYGTNGGTLASFGALSGLSEGYHYATFLGANGNNSSTASFGAAAALFGRLSAAVTPASGG